MNFAIFLKANANANANANAIAANSIFEQKFRSFQFQFDLFFYKIIHTSRDFLIK